MYVFYNVYYLIQKCRNILIISQWFIKPISCVPSWGFYFGGGFDFWHPLMPATPAILIRNKQR